MKLKSKIFFLLTLITLNLFIPSYAKSDHSLLKKTGGVVTGILISPFVACCRGFKKGSKLGTDYMAKILGGGDTSFGRAIGFLTGGLVNGAAAGAVGIIKGGYDGIKYGKEKPFSKESYSLTENYSIF